MKTKRGVFQVRAWDGTRGSSYEEARALGGRFGSSPEFELTTYPTGTVTFQDTADSGSHVVLYRARILD
jgi:hypothetical protein